MNYSTEVFGDVVVVHTPEELNEDQAVPFGTYVARLEQKKVVFDLDNTETIDSAGLKSLTDNQTRLRDKMGMLKIATTNATNRKILEITRLDLQLEVFDSVIDAVKSFR
ncbi:MAG: STAS domain-containing protein [Planctomycetaceae bacterium]|nr:STAS domain-containing protein [Planctomycetaceae bacterium]